ncbi:MAG TPA: ATP-binding protein, partial [Candidatus Hydrogenedentes bacterium]|nr:ATP-binding protein [Candidatus Hydrogenedentota bacterium]
VVEDITNERLLAESQALLSRAIEQVDSIVAVFNERGQFVYANPAFSALTGMTGDQLHGKPFSTLASAQLPEATLTEIVRVVTSGTSWKGRVVLRNAQAGFAHVDMTVSPIWRGEGTLSHFVLLGHDVTRELLLEQQLRQSQRLESIGRLAGGIAHDFNNMLQVVGGYTELMRSQLPPDSPYHRALEVCARVTDRAARLVRQLMLFGRRDQPDKPELFALSQTISDFLKLLRKVIGEHIEVRFDAQLQGDLVMGQPEQVERVVLNLCVNARDAMPEGGTITLRTTTHSPETLPVAWPVGLPVGTYYCLEVADTGTGIPPEVMEHIFEPFFTTKEAGRGTGLGLSVAY